MTVKQHYDQHLGNFYSWIAGDFNTQQQQFENFLKEQNIFPSSTKVAFDLGAGHGIQSVALAYLGFRVKAIDFNEQLLMELKAQANNLDVETVQADMRQFKEYISDTPELIICWGDTLTHLDSKADIYQLIQDISHTLPRGGKLLLSFRNYTNSLSGDNRFIHVKSDEQRIATCFLEYFTDYVRVTDLLYEKNGPTWVQKVSSYNKVIINPEEVRQEIQNNGLRLLHCDTLNGMIRIIADK
ncbi:class I SAM-dependent methyltransferase [Rhodocytophaga aerolata]|uniref:Class I SAM-dependent methyltransferase n=1 Tax=Rhodocytophaga aerolata TaxID=455078 RepID=A0ABT8R084_9BACT|nr:class I SAM-dependent methyltransferase [Rhodocytophaga aerolata]MDO1445507.1 class I SAM-dependent methyltransferase [Rhodocytophaga aerolata]